MLAAALALFLHAADPPDKNLAGITGMVAYAAHKPSGDVVVPAVWNDYLRRKLKSAGIAYVTRSDENHFPGRPALILLVADDFSRVDLELRQDVYLARAPSVATSAVTWSCTSPMTADPPEEYCVDRFVREYRAANPATAVPRR